MKVKKLIELLEKLPKDFDVYVFEHGNVYDFPVSGISGRKCYKDAKQVVLTGGN